MSSNDSVGYTIERVDVGVTVTGYSDGSPVSYTHLTLPTIYSV